MSEVLMNADLQRSGLTSSDLRCRPANPPELSACGVNSMSKPAYAIPYYSLIGDPLQFYRLRMLGEGEDVKYRQPKGTGNYLYFPPGFYRLFARSNFVVVTEGEKKAAYAVKRGIPCAGLGGVDNWRSRVLLLPEQSEIDQDYGTAKALRVKIPSGTELEFDTSGSVPAAIGLSDLVDHCLERNVTIVICYDSDLPTGTKPDVQRAAASLGYELRFRGLPTTGIRQLVLPTDEEDPDSKVGLDDFLMNSTDAEWQYLLRETMSARSAFPRMPSTKAYINKRLQKPKMTRKETSEVALAVSSELDSQGHRLKDAVTGELFYFDEENHTLMPVQLMQHHQIPLHETPFGQLLYDRFNLTVTDQRVLSWLASQFTGEPGLSESKTYKVFARPNHPKLKDAIVYQISDSQFAVIRADPKNPLEIVDNGTYGVLFEQGHVSPLRGRVLMQEFQEQNRKAEVHPHWRDVLGEMNFPDAKAEQVAVILFYASPWLNRWRGTQLPVELIFGEAGSGKSSLYGLRQHILTGLVSLANLSNDIRDWYAGISSSGGLYVLDNVHFTAGAKDIRQRLSDEMCRLITEPEPHIEMRKLYTTSGIVRLPITSTFAITSIEQSFFNEDLIQRAAILELSAVRDYHDSSWTERQMARAGSREGWVAHHMVVLHRFLKLAQEKWNENFKAKHRLRNYEQMLLLLGEVLRMDVSDLSEQLRHKQDAAITEADWVLQGLVEFVREWKMQHPNSWMKERVSTRDIVSWAETHEQHGKNSILSNSWRLGKYFTAHAQSIERVTGIAAAGTYGNRKVYMVRPDAPIKSDS